MKFNTVLEKTNTYEPGKNIEFVMREYGISKNDIIKLASNENPYGCSPKVISTLKNRLKNLSIYPDDSMYNLKAAISEKYLVSSDNIIVGSGSDQILDYCVRSKCNKNSKVLMINTTFSMYEVYAKHSESTIIKTKSSEQNLDELYKLYQIHGADLIFLCLPNNPTGDCLDIKEVYSFLEKINNNTLVVIDGAYQEFAAFRDVKKMIIPKELIEKYPNTIYTGTFSKAYGLGGMRVGYGIAQPNIIKALNKIRSPFNLTSLSLDGAVIAIKEEDYLNNYLIKNYTEMLRYEEYFSSRSIDYIPSYTNFITVMLKNNLSSKIITEELLKKGLIIRDLSAYNLNAIRISIGTKYQNSIVFEMLDEVLLPNITRRKEKC